MNELTVNISKTIQAPIEEVFDAWLSPEKLSKFMTPMPGMPDCDVENDPRVGGNFSIIMHFEGQKLPHTGEYLEIDRPHKLVFTWVSHASIENSTVTLSFNRRDDNTTDVSLSHVKFIDEEIRSNHEGGWRQILETLNTVVT